MRGEFKTFHVNARVGAKRYVAKWKTGPTWCRIKSSKRLAKGGKSVAVVERISIVVSVPGSFSRSLGIRDLSTAEP